MSISLAGPVANSLDPNAPKASSSVPDVQNYLTTFDLTQTGDCAPSDNRFSIKNVFDETTGNTVDLYCWRGRVQFSPGNSTECDIGSVCDPYSYANARTRFCLQWGCTPNLYVSNAGTVDAGAPVLNDRGGVVVYNDPTTCEGGFVNTFQCVIAGLKQSFSNALDPANKTTVGLSIALILTVVVTAAVLYRKYRNSKAARAFKTRDVFS